MEAETLAAMVSNGRLEIRKIRGRYQLANGALHASDLGAEALGGRLSASLDVDHIDTAPASHLRAALHSISLNATQRVFRRAELARVAISGVVDGTTDASWVGSVSNARARVDLTIRGARTGNAADASTKNIPVEGTIHAIYDGPRNELTLHQTTLRIPATTFTAEGQVSKRSRLQMSTT